MSAAGKRVPPLGSLSLTSEPKRVDGNASSDRNEKKQFETRTGLKPLLLVLNLLACVNWFRSTCSRSQGARTLFWMSSGPFMWNLLWVSVEPLDPGSGGLSAGSGSSGWSEVQTLQQDELRYRRAQSADGSRIQPDQRPHRHPVHTGKNPLTQLLIHQ